MAIPELENFPLVGGTNLSLRFGHRLSVDLDLFTNTPFVPDEVFSAIVNACPQTVRIDQRKQTIWLSINGIKVDLILHEYSYIKGIEEIEGIRLLSVEDVIPMKLEAMATRGVKSDGNSWSKKRLLGYCGIAKTLFIGPNATVS